ncbi:MAG TPA: PQQ-dependent sugar dehydrogenase [Gemmatimonadaceae bacterium]|nr:PQQ-dependent sugar dehydrogenase [Gemmatimonadaceae bacterium]
MNKALKALGALRALRTFSAYSALSAFSAFGLLACDDDVVSPVLGALEVTIAGVPAGESAAVTVTGPDGFSETVTTTTRLDDLDPGTYTVVAANIERADGRWSPTPPTQSVNVVRSATPASATVTYALVTARLAVNISGLPSGASASVTVTGPGGYTNTLTSSTAIELLTPGAYTITAADVVSGGVTYRPAPTTQTVQLPASTTQVAANVVYSVGTGSLTVTIDGLSAGVNGAVQVTGPSGYNQQITTTQTLTVPPGTYTITASPVASSLTTHTPTPATQTVTVTTGATASGAVTYAPSPLVLGAQQQWVGADLGDVVHLASPPGDPRIFVVDQAGRIYVIKNGVPLTTPFLNISNLVAYGGEQGLLSVAFDPQFATNGRFYVYHNDLNGDITVARYTATGDVADPASRMTVITIPHPVQGNHNGGLVMFGPDGMLYLATGDGGGGGDPANNAQNINSLLGKMLRLDVTSLPYSIPAGNPFVGATGADEIWALGLRNPWRFAFDPPTAMLYIADVGQNLWEEVNAVAATTAGVNYGWRIMEGNHCFNPSTNCPTAGLTLPVFEYSHAAGNCSITGGFVYRGAAIPELVGHYLYADFCVGVLRSFRLSGGQPVEHTTWSIGSVGNIKSFGLDAAGEIYILTGGGRVYRVVKQ